MACGDSGTPTNDGQLVPDSGPAQAPANTAELKVGENFDFSSSRSIDINFDIADAAGSDASVSLMHTAFCR